MTKLFVLIKIPLDQIDRINDRADFKRKLVIYCNYGSTFFYQGIYVPQNPQPLRKITRSKRRLKLEFALVQLSKPLDPNS